MRERKILHIDMDAFFASVEQADYPELKGKPVVVGSPSSRGVIAAASYEARKYGVRSAMPSQQAMKLCGSLVFRKNRMSRYKEVSGIIFGVFNKYSTLVEALSVDEAFIDVSATAGSFKEAGSVALEIKKDISNSTGLTCSAGLSVNKFLAKLASDVNKPDGLFIIKPGEINDYISGLAIEDFFGIGRVSAEKMHRYGIHNGRDLRNADIDFLKRNFGKAGEFFYNIARGIDEREVDPFRERKSVGAELTFERDLITQFEIIAELYKLEKELWSRLNKHGKSGRTITLKVRYDDFSQVTRSLTTGHCIKEFKELHVEVTKLREQVQFERRGIRLIGVSVSNLGDEQPDEQLSIWQ